MHVDRVQLSSKAFFLSFFPLFGRFVFAFLTIKYLLPFDMFSLFMHSAGPLWLLEVLPVKRISSLTLKRTNSLRVGRLQRRINTKFCSNLRTKQSLRKQNSNKLLCYRLFTILYGQTGSSTV